MSQARNVAELRGEVAASRRLARTLASAETDGPTSRSLLAAEVFLERALSELDCVVRAGQERGDVWDRITGG